MMPSNINQWNPIKADFSGTNQAMVGAQNSFSQAGTIFGQMRRDILDQEQKNVENQFREKQLEEQIRATGVAEELSRDTFNIQQERWATEQGLQADYDTMSTWINDNIGNYTDKDGIIDTARLRNDFINSPNRVGMNTPGSLELFDKRITHYEDINARTRDRQIQAAAVAAQRTENELLKAQQRMELEDKQYRRLISQDLNRMLQIGDVFRQDDATGISEFEHLGNLIKSPEFKNYSPEEQRGLIERYKLMSDVNHIKTTWAEDGRITGSISAIGYGRAVAGLYDMYGLDSSTNSIVAAGLREEERVRKYDEENQKNINAERLKFQERVANDPKVRELLGRIFGLNEPYRMVSNARVMASQYGFPELSFWTVINENMNNNNFWGNWNLNIDEFIKAENKANTTFGSMMMPYSSFRLSEGEEELPLQKNPPNPGTTEQASSILGSIGGFFQDLPKTMSNISDEILFGKSLIQDSADFVNEHIETRAKQIAERLNRENIYYGTNFRRFFGKNNYSPNSEYIMKLARDELRREYYNQQP